MKRPKRPKSEKLSTDVNQMIDTVATHFQARNLPGILMLDRGQLIAEEYAILTEYAGRCVTALLGAIEVEDMEPIFIDIETTVTSDEQIKKQIAEQISHPAQMKKAETIAKWEEEKKPQAVEEAIARTSLDGSYGRITAIAISDGKTSAVIMHRDEADLLRCLWRLSCPKHNPMPYVVGYNLDFDLPFIWKRAAINDIKLPDWMPRPYVKIFSDGRGATIDLMHRWTGYRDKALKLTELARLLAANGTDAFSVAVRAILRSSKYSGEDMPKLWQQGNYAAIANHAEEDLLLTDYVYRRFREVGLA